MYFQKFLTIVVSILCLQTSTFAQEKLNFKFGKVEKEDFNLTSSLVDSGTAAVVIADFGKSDFISNPSELTFSLIYRHKKRVKILKNSGFDAATVVIPLYTSNSGNEEKLQDLKAYTYNVENGKVVEIKLNKDQVYSEKASKNWVHKKFTFPGVREGSIIEYSYEVKSDFFFNLQAWEFQGQYPILWSQYEAAIPEFFKYIITSQGYQSFVVKKTDRSVATFNFTERVEREVTSRVTSGSGTNSFQVEGNMDYHTWVMKDVPGLKIEPYTTTILNSIAKIEFQLQQIAYRGSIPRDYTNTWEKLSSELLEDENFGYQINRPNLWLDNDVDQIVAGPSGSGEQAKKIFEFVRDNFACTGYNSFRTSGNLRDVLKKKSGTVADINLLLIAMLKSKKINVEPVLLSTREHGTINPFYPMLDRFNYVIARVNLGGAIIYLDAARKGVAFGKLPSQLYNGHARVISKTGHAVQLDSDSLMEHNSTRVFVFNDDSGAVKGFSESVAGLYGSMDIRNSINKSSLNEFQKLVQQSSSEDAPISNVAVDSLKLIDEPITIKYDIDFKAFGDADMVYFNPMIGEAIKNNPFASAERFYPVEMPFTKKSTFILNMELPKGYKVEELPKSVRVSLNEDQGMFEYLISSDGKYVQLKCELHIKKTNFPNEDYQTLRDFYAFVVKKEAEQIVFKKIK